MWLATLSFFTFPILRLTYFQALPLHLNVFFLTAVFAMAVKRVRMRNEALMNQDLLQNNLKHVNLIMGNVKKAKS
jgi:gluconate kinase